MNFSNCQVFRPLKSEMYDVSIESGVPQKVCDSDARFFFANKQYMVNEIVALVFLVLEAPSSKTLIKVSRCLRFIQEARYPIAKKSQLRF